MITALTSLMSFPVALIAAGSFCCSEYTVRGNTSVRGAGQALYMIVSQMTHVKKRTPFRADNRPLKSNDRRANDYASTYHLEIFCTARFEKYQAQSRVLDQTSQNNELTALIRRVLIA